MEEISLENATAPAPEKYEIRLAPSAKEESALLTKLVAIYEAVDHVEKRGLNKFQNYNYVKASDIARALRDAFKVQKVYALPKFSIVRTYTIPAKEGEMQAVDVECALHLVDSETGTSIQTNGFGSGTDKGDKAIFKAQTGAMKYALRNAFMIPDESDPEADEDVDRQTSGRTETVQQQGIRQQVIPPLQQGRIGGEKVKFPPITTQTIISTPPAVARTVETTTSAPTPLPAPEVVAKSNYDGYIARAVQLATALQKAGLKGAESSVRIKIKKFLCKTAKVTDLKEITDDQWEVMLGVLEENVKTADGAAKAVASIEAAAKEAK